MESETKRIVPEDAVDRTIVIPPEAVGDASPNDSGGADETPPAPAKIGGSSRRSIFGDLGNFLFPHRSVVDDTIELIRAGAGEEGTEDASDKRSAPVLTDVANLYALADKPFASGGQGRISKAVDRALGCEIAVKSLHEKFRDDERARKNFLTEAQLTASLDHPAIIPIHGLFGDARNGMHLAMKLISGHTLSTYLKHIVSIYEKKGIRHFNERKSLRSRIEIFLRVCEAVEHAHARKIIHRDLKLENIMIGRHRETYVTDWGLAMRLEDGKSLKKVDGTPGFIAPEVLTERRADVRSDIYSLGIILFELVTLSQAFPDAELSALLKMVKQGAHLPLRHRFRYRIDGDLKAIILKAIRLDPDRRYQKVGELAEDLRRYLANEETSARPDGFFAKVCRWSVNHHRGMLLTVMTLLLLGIGGVARTLYKEFQWSRERRMRDNAIGAVYSDVTRTANTLEKNMERIEYQLEQLRMNVLFSSLKIKSPNRLKREFFIPLEDYRNAPPPGVAYAESYRHEIDLDGACVFNFLTGKVDLDRLRFFNNTAQYMRDAVLDPGKLGENEARERLLQQGRAIKKIYFLLADGTFACYPGSKNDFPDGYDPRQRIWYQRAEQAKGRMVWSEPYQDSGIRGESMITCSAAIYGADERFIGMGAIDFSLTALAEKMLGPQGKHIRFTHEKMLINPKGEVIFRMVPPERSGTRPFADRALIRRMLLMRYGTLLTVKNGREMLLAFAYLDSIDVLYVEYLDMGALVAQQRREHAESEEEEPPAPPAVAPAG